MTTINILAPSSSQQGLLIIISSSRIGVNCHEARSSHHSVPEAKSCPPLSQPHGNPLIGWISCHSHFIQVISPVTVIFLGSRSQHDHIIDINHLVIGFVGSYVIIACYIVVAPNKRQPFCGSGLCVLAMDCGESHTTTFSFLTKTAGLERGSRRGGRFTFWHQPALVRRWMESSGPSWFSPPTMRRPEEHSCPLATAKKSSNRITQAIAWLLTFNDSH